LKTTLLTSDPGTWNDAAVEAAWSKDTPAEQKPYNVYAASKTESERAAWKWFKERKPGFAFNTILPNMNVSLSLSLSMLAWLIHY
jgi:nucleoside-diphosphate-sugar epimerase